MFVKLPCFRRLRIWALQLSKNITTNTSENLTIHTTENTTPHTTNKNTTTNTIENLVPISKVLHCNCCGQTSSIAALSFPLFCKGKKTPEDGSANIFIVYFLRNIYCNFIEKISFVLFLDFIVPYNYSINSTKLTLYKIWK